MRELLPLLGVLWAAASGAIEEPRIEHLLVQPNSHKLLVSFELVGAFDEEMLARVQSGLPTQLEYTLRLERPRRWWFDKVFEKSTLQVVAMYNAVTREYLVNQKLDGRLIDSRVVTNVAELERAMTLMRSIPAFDVPDEPRPRTQVMVRAELGSKPILLLFPNRIATNWAKRRLIELVSPGLEPARSSRPLLP